MSSLTKLPTRLESTVFDEYSMDHTAKTGRAMNGATVKVLSSHAVRDFIRAGGNLRYRPGRDDQGRYWEVLAIEPGGNELPEAGSRKYFAPPMP